MKDAGLFQAAGQALKSSDIVFWVEPHPDENKTILVFSPEHIKHYTERSIHEFTGDDFNIFIDSLIEIRRRIYARTKTK